MTNKGSIGPNMRFVCHPEGILCPKDLGFNSWTTRGEILPLRGYWAIAPLGMTKYRNQEEKGGRDIVSRLFSYPPFFPGSHMTVVITAVAMQIRVKRRNACRVPNRVQPNPM